MGRRSINYYVTLDLETGEPVAVYRVVKEPSGRTAGYIAHARTAGQWLGDDRFIYKALGYAGGIAPEDATRDEALRIVHKWGVDPDELDGSGEALPL